ncbi:NAD(P)-binding protein [Aureobasidium subglaciale]|nr:NAD(P)-binding protein [Aureobasidium subglaciale]
MPSSIPAESGLNTVKEHASIWEDAPFLHGTTRFEPQSGISNIMITGGAGFIASWVVRHLTKTYQGHYNIISFDKLDYCATLNNTAQLGEDMNFTFHKGDITKHEDVMDCLRKHDVDTVMHFAAQTHVDLSFGNSNDFTSTNVVGTHVLLECVKLYGVNKFIHVSTDEVYGEVKDDGKDLLEDALLLPTNPYAASKAAAEMYVEAYRKSFNVPAIVVRSNNVYGPHQFPEKVIPKFSMLLQRHEKLSLHGDGTHTRRYLYAGDAADAFDTILHRGQVGQVYNVGSSDEISNFTLCSMLLRQFGHPDGTKEEVYKHVVHCEDRPFNDHRYAVDGSKLKQLGWKQKTTFEEGLSITVGWYRRYGDTWWGDISDRLTPFPTVPTEGQIDIARDTEMTGAPVRTKKSGKRGFDEIAGSPDIKKRRETDHHMDSVLGAVKV